MSTGHTNCTWSAGVATVEGKECFVVGQAGTTKVIAVTGYVGAADEAESIANAYRIEKCVNALSDLPQLALDGGWTRAGLEAHNAKLAEQVIRLNGEAKVLRDLLELTLTPLSTVDPESTAESDALKELTEKIIQALRAPVQTQGVAL